MATGAPNIVVMQFRIAIVIVALDFADDGLILLNRAHSISMSRCHERLPSLIAILSSMYTAVLTS